jgi:predicted Zn-dependent protease
VKRAAVLAAVLAACAVRDPTPVAYEPDRRDYAAFAADRPEIYEPNYLPFMVHRAAPSDDRRGDLLFFCRWDDAAMPLRVFIPEIAIPEELQDEFNPRDSDGYVAGVQEALRTWERSLDGLVSFQLVGSADAADLTIFLVAARAPESESEFKVLGSTSTGAACRVDGGDPEAERVEVSFAVPELRVYLADEFGLLGEDQVQWIALHEIGPALGMRGHSPIPADPMYPVARDRRSVPEGLSDEDVNSFESLYRLPNGAIFGWAGPPDAAPGEPVASGPGPPALAMAPYVDVRRGYSLRLPAGWTHFGTEHGLVVVDGATWDYTASFQVMVQRYATIQDYLERYGRYYGSRGAMSPPVELVVSERRAVQVEIALFDVPRIEQVTLVEIGDGRLLVVTADSPIEKADEYRPWFRALVASLAITDQPEDAWPEHRP